MTHHPIAIVGGGPAGIACAVQLHHAGLHPLLIEREQLGGLLPSANWVENYPGFPNGIKGSDLAELFSSQFLNYVPEIEHASVTAVDWDGNLFQLVLGDRTISTETLIVATGTVPKPLPEYCSKLNGRIHSEIIPLLGVSGKTIAIVGAGDAAFDYALSLARANDVVILSRSPQPKCLPRLAQMVRDNPRIQYLPNSDITDIAVDQDGRLQPVMEHAAEDVLPGFDSVLFAIGRVPELGFISDGLLEKKAELEEKRRLFLIGDAVNGHCRQTAIAVGQGVMAAMQIMEKMKQA